MSSPAPSSRPAPASAGAVGDSSGTAHAHRDDSLSVSDSDPPAASFCSAEPEADHTAPAARLYRHALESIFAFLRRQELAVALRVSRGWLGAVQSMGALQLSVKAWSIPLCILAHSAMGRHVVRLDRPFTLTADSLYILAFHMPHLRALHCELQPPLSVGRVLALPPALRELDVRLADAPPDTNTIIGMCARLPLLEELALRVPRADQYAKVLPLDPRVSFAPLAALPRLRAFTLALPDFDPTQLSDTQADELHALSRLHKFAVQYEALSVSPVTARVLGRLLRRPHDLQWRRVRLPGPLDDEAAALLPQLPALTRLDELRTGCARFDWLGGLPNLVSVSLCLLDRDRPAAPAGHAESLAAGLRRCQNLTHLRLRGYTDLTTAQLTELLPRLPLLRELDLDSLAFDSLSFLAQQPMTSQLTKLALKYCQQLPWAELRHVHSLRGLEDLSLIGSLTAEMDEQTQAQYRPPSLLLPQLHSFDYWR